MMRRFFPSTIRQVDEAVGFVFEINTANTSTGSTTNTQFKLPLVSTGTYDFDVDWGDSTSDTITVWNEAATTHTYAATGSYTVTITRKIEGWFFSNTGDRLKMINISNWGSVEFLSNAVNPGTSGAFSGCSNLDVTATDTPNLQGNISGFFQFCTNLVGNSSFNDWNIPIDGSSVRSLFTNCTSFNQNLGNWNLSTILTFSSMFQGCTNFNNGGSDSIKNWDVSSGTALGGANAGMFFNATSFNQPIGLWNTSSCQTFRDMFRGATAFDQNIGSWNVSNGVNFSAFMFGKTALNFSAANLDAIYNGWSSRPVNASIGISFGTIKYTAAGQAGRDILTGAPNNWSIVDGGI